MLFHAVNFCLVVGVVEITERGSDFFQKIKLRKGVKIMASVKKVRLFISHAWDYNKQYDNLIKLLRIRPYFEFYNHSVPKHDPLDSKTKKEL